MVDQHQKSRYIAFIKACIGICMYGTDSVHFTYSAQSYFQVFLETHTFEVAYHIPKYPFYNYSHLTHWFIEFPLLLTKVCSAKRAL